MFKYGRRGDKEVQRGGRWGVCWYYGVGCVSDWS